MMEEDLHKLIEYVTSLYRHPRFKLSAEDHANLSDICNVLRHLQMRRDAEKGRGRG